MTKTEFIELHEAARKKIAYAESQRYALEREYVAYNAMKPGTKCRVVTRQWTYEPGSTVYVADAYVDGLGDIRHRVYRSKADGSPSKKVSGYRYSHEELEILQDDAQVDKGNSV